ncbi:MAG TPA: maltotransferase domain-containing protein [Geminicoccus sp.]|jgi:starch synthase (maltosyl-transferring)|uniref:maltotransferase domain-containing protein n=1 Tax=Geminicoccus sp. TaxID=2024832 RepID=UPI002E378132|nr:maltotransferase domain-containing protein [Geminicoccus sp.]HEX2526019.1 maltotransferase domain-containing protein [Geminicoccus sp.]
MPTGKDLTWLATTFWLPVRILAMIERMDTGAPGTKTDAQCFFSGNHAGQVIASRLPPVARPPPTDQAEQRRDHIVPSAEDLLTRPQELQVQDIGHAAPRIYYVHPLLVGPLDAWDTIFEHAAGLGFDTVLTAPPFAPGHGESLFLPHDMGRLHPALGHDDAASGLARLVEMARAHGLALMLDIVVDRVAADSTFAMELGLTPAHRGALDPRRDPADRDAVIISYDPASPADHPYISMLAERLGSLAAAGIAGFRCLHWERVPPTALSHLVARVREGSPGTRFLAWTPGTRAEARQAVRSVGFDGVFSSVCWWDLQSGWLPEERELQRTIGYEIAFPEVPFDKRLTHEVEIDEVLKRHAIRTLWLAAAFGDGLLVPMGFEYGCRDRLDPTRGDGKGLAGLQERGGLDLSGPVRAANEFLAQDAGRFARLPVHVVTGNTSTVTVMLRIDAEDARQAKAARLILVNADLRRPAEATGSFIISEAGSRFVPFRDLDGGQELSPVSTVRLGPGEVRILEGRPHQAITGVVRVPPIEEAVTAPRMIIEKIQPAVDDGAFPVKRTVGQVVHVEADIFNDGHDPIAAVLVWRPVDEQAWRETRMTLLTNDRWMAAFPLERLGRHEFAIEAWRDPFAIFRYELDKKVAAGLDVTLELEEGRLIVEAASRETEGAVADRVRPIAQRLVHADYDTRVQILMSPETSAVMTAADRRPFRLRSHAIPLDAERSAAEFGSWYELFPRSQSNDPNRHGTFDDVIRRLPAIRDMGFDVLYLPPIHPIGRTHRKGKNNSLTAGPDDPGSPYAIGAEEGGHDAIHPELGTFDDFHRLVEAAAGHGLEIALDIAIQASPDHPWLKEHPDWFDWRPDGTIRYAENPPKKYEDIVNVDFYAKGAVPSLWVELRDVILLWVGHGVKLFRIDNPHTKPFPFWEWLIADVRRDHPDVVFLAEAFTRPKVMYRLAKIGFSQSYTYFTWRNTKAELTEYLTELAQTEPKDFFRPHFFVNTPDINPDFLQDAPRSAYLIRAALATTMSGLWGMYNGFEICEGRPDAKKKEYADSEKYEIRAWDWNRPGNIIAEISSLNRIRRSNPALHSHLGITFLNAWNDNILFFEKATPGRENVLLIAVSVDPQLAQEADVEIPLWKFGIPDHGSLVVDDLMRNRRLTWTGKYQRIRCDPGEIPFSIWRVAAKG